ncbi:hypothetical protein GJ744_010163 [Endocarpon pusillum]|uniref:YTH domain-containing protein n=1 Tax=Endocarpon pusillum TaxID=364733 RepID=A0A8H7AGM0_9EURO|nr:hypothetical protein GJ744_010163 [Endocarpon pusillum]
MAQQPSDQDNQDYTSLTEAIIPSNIYLNSWSSAALPVTPSIQDFVSGSDIKFPLFGGMLPLQNATETAVLPTGLTTSNHAAFDANAGLQLVPATHDHDRGMEMIRASADLQPQSTAPSSHFGVSENKARATSTNDPLANLKMRAKESVMAKRTRSIRSASNDSKVELAGVVEPDLTHNGEFSNTVRPEELGSKSRGPTFTNRAPSLPPSASLLVSPRVSAKATSAELEDLLAEGRAAASLSKATTAENLSTTEQHGLNGQQHQSREPETSGVRESRENSVRYGETATNLQATLKPEHFPTYEIDEIDAWLAMTGYYDIPYRKKVLTRRRRLQAIEEERLKLLEEENEDQRLRGPFSSIMSIHAPQQPTSPVATKSPSMLTVKQDVGLRIKDSAFKKTTAQELTTSNVESPVKRRIEEDTKDSEVLHPPKVARTQGRRRTPPRSQRASPERRPKRSASPEGTKNHSATSPRKQSPHSKDDYDRWLPDREVHPRGLKDRALEENAWRNELRGRHDHRRDSGFDTSHASKPDMQDGRVRFFLLKSWNYENIATAQREGTWATQTKNEDTFVEAFKTCRHVIFFFSANHSKAFQGYARMQGLPGEKGVAQPSWVKNLHWPTTAPFRIKWIVKEETPYRAVGNLKNPLNENLAVFVGRDGQEIPEKIGLQMTEIIDDDTAYRAELRR